MLYVLQKCASFKYHIWKSNPLFHCTASIQITIILAFTFISMFTAFLLILFFVIQKSPTLFCVLKFKSGAAAELYSFAKSWTSCWVGYSEVAIGCWTPRFTLVWLNIEQSLQPLISRIFCTCEDAQGFYSGTECFCSTLLRPRSSQFNGRSLSRAGIQITMVINSSFS